MWRQMQSFLEDYGCGCVWGVPDVSKPKIFGNNPEYDPEREMLKIPGFLSDLGAQGKANLPRTLD